MNGRRSLEQIWERLQYGVPLERESLVEYVGMLADEGIVCWV